MPSTQDPAAMTIRAYQAADESAVVELWERSGLVRPQNDPRKDIRRKMEVSPELFLVGVVNSEVIATAMAGYDGHRGWIYYLAVDPRLQKLGYGRDIMLRAEDLLLERGCPKINLQVRSSNQAVIEFYRHLGFSTDDVLSMGKRLIPDQPVSEPRLPHEP